MMLLSVLLYGFLLCNFLLLGWADETPRWCGVPDQTDEEAQAIEADFVQRQTQAESKLKSGVVRARSTGGVIKVYMHIITDSSGNGALSDTIIDDQIDVLNSAFNSSGFSFVEVGRDVIVNDTWFNMVSGDEASEYAAKRALRRGTGEDLNFYTASLADNLLGWATLPWGYNSVYGFRDGVVCRYTTLPGASSGSYSLGDTGTHEVGHWMGLYHTFRGGCQEGGDFVSDTPQVAEPNYGCPGSVDSCPDDGQGDDQTWNFMDYTNDACMDTFTTGQNTRMQQAWDSYRDGTSCYVNCESDSPTAKPSGEPTQPSGEPSGIPSGEPTTPTGEPTGQPSSEPSGEPTHPTEEPTAEPSGKPSSEPTQPTGEPSGEPTSRPSQPSGEPSGVPTGQPTQPTGRPTGEPSGEPTQPTGEPSGSPSSEPTQPTGEPSGEPTHPTGEPSGVPSGAPSQPTGQPTAVPSGAPTQPTGQPSVEPSSEPSQPTGEPSGVPSGDPTQPSGEPSGEPTSVPTQPTGEPTGKPSLEPTQPTGEPTRHPTQPTGQPSGEPSGEPSQPTGEPSGVPSGAPTQPTGKPSGEPTSEPTQPTGEPSCEPTQPSGEPSGSPSGEPTQPTGKPSGVPTGQPTQPTADPSGVPSGEPSQPTGQPSSEPTHPKGEPTSQPFIPTGEPSRVPSGQPTEPSGQPTGTLIPICTPGDRAFCNNRGVCANNAGTTVCICDDYLHYWPSEQCAVRHNGRELLPGQVCYPNTKDQYCSWLGSCNTDGSACVCDDADHRLPEEQCRIWHQVIPTAAPVMSPTVSSMPSASPTHPLLLPTQLVPTSEPSITATTVCEPGDRNYCNNRGLCSAAGDECVCDDVYHYWSSEQCSTYHWGRELEAGHMCFPDTVDYYCNFLGVCASDGLACECFDSDNRSPVDACKSWNPAPTPAPAPLPAGHVCVPGETDYCSSNGYCLSTGDGCACWDEGHYWPSDQCSTYHHGPELADGDNCCLPGYVDYYCSWMGVCAPDGSSCICHDEAHYWPSDRCQQYHSGPDPVNARTGSCPALLAIPEEFGKSGSGNSTSVDGVWLYSLLGAMGALFVLGIVAYGGRRYYVESELRQHESSMYSVYSSGPASSAEQSFNSAMYKHPQSDPEKMELSIVDDYGLHEGGEVDLSNMAGIYQTVSTPTSANYRGSTTSSLTQRPSFQQSLSRNLSATLSLSSGRTATKSGKHKPVFDVDEEAFSSVELQGTVSRIEDENTEIEL